MRTFVKFILLAEAFAVATYAVGWWMVPVIAAIWGLLSKDAANARFAGFAAAAGWATLLLLDVSRGQVGVMASQLAGVMKLPAVALYLLTLIFPALLAWCAATLAPTIRERSVA
jgi:hypothetical protein